MCGWAPCQVLSESQQKFQSLKTQELFSEKFINTNKDLESKLSCSRQYLFISLMGPDGLLSTKCTCYIFRTKAMGKLCDTIWVNAATNALDSSCTWFWINYWLLQRPNIFIHANFSWHSPCIQLPYAINGNLVYEAGVLRKGRESHKKEIDTTASFTWCLIKPTSRY